jgi:uncharacterized membrane protein YagU involved in acid resistance
MRQPGFSATRAILWGGLAAGVLDIAAVFAFWLAKGVGPLTILQSIATSVLGREAFELGAFAVLVGVFLHFAVSYVFAAAYVVASSRVPVLRSRPVMSGVAYGVIAYVIMTSVVVPLSRADFGDWPPPLINLAASLFIHLFLFGLPIALAASRIAEPEAPTAKAAENRSG